jgi:DNA-binding response OmpR family regulator
MEAARLSAMSMRNLRGLYPAGEGALPIGAERSVRGDDEHTLRLVTSRLAKPDNRAAACILVVDEDPTVRQMVVDFLGEHNMRAVAAGGRHEMARRLAESEPHLVILDRRLGEADGLDLLRELRARSDIPVIITNGHRCDEIDRVVGLELGADDYLIKPFGLRELVARIRAVLRRRACAPVDRQERLDRGRYRFDGWELDRRTRRLTDPHGNPVRLTKGQYAILNAFLDAPQRPLSREHLLQATRVHEDILDRSIDVQVLRLRRKLKSDPGASSTIQTERGVGYVFALPVERL